VGTTLGVYPTGGGFGIGDQSIDYQGVHLDAVRFGVSQALSSTFRMGFELFVGFSLLADPGYVGANVLLEEGQSDFGFHWGFGIGGYHRFDMGLTLGFGADISFASGEFLDTSFFRVLPAIGWEIRGPLHEWFLHARWVTGITVLQGLEERNTAPLSNLTTTGIQIVYGF
jgi:hypothetical protein